ncbi:MAG: YraN family protein [Cytophagales bacterium]|jgi:putative endonuclease|nr:YraN family protein [Cytophagales bacterium]
MTTKVVGKKGEDATLQYLFDRGCELLERNYRYKKNEIDIIVKKNTTICFVEVKKRGSQKFGYPESFVSEGQKERIREAAENFIIENNWKGNIRFDISAVTGDHVEYFEDAF